jgi:hypothetical protein
MSTSIDNACGQIEMPLLKREAAADAAATAFFTTLLHLSERNQLTPPNSQLLFRAL